mmetsp:Transcript_24304/g.49824  ORF Transcript_24304/g.49824 Transcript_24304/m.49824 type:complete len:283 (-) Transcript_24304:621-1469(-)
MLLLLLLMVLLTIIQSTSASNRIRGHQRRIPRIPHTSQYDLSKRRNIIGCVIHAVVPIVLRSVVVVFVMEVHVFLPGGEGCGDGGSVVHPAFKFEVQHDILSIRLSPNLRNLIPHHTRLLQIAHEIHPQLDQKLSRLLGMIRIIQPILVIGKGPEKQQLSGTILNPKSLFPFPHEYGPEGDAGEDVAGMDDEVGFGQGGREGGRRIFGEVFGVVAARGRWGRGSHVGEWVDGCLSFFFRGRVVIVSFASAAGLGGSISDELSFFRIFVFFFFRVDIGIAVVV